VSNFQPSGVITLTTDLGHKGPFVAVMKGVILTRNPDVRLIDLTHETEAHFPAEAGFWLRRAYPWFPPGTVHIAVVDPGVGMERDILVVLHDGHCFVAPDNGLLANIHEEEGAVTRRLDLSDPARLGLGEVSHTFHGRDILSPIGAELAAGRLSPQDVGPVADSVIPSWVEEPVITEDRIKGQVVAVDSFGNLITNVSETELLTWDAAVAIAGGHRFPVRRTYGLVAPGENVGLINSFGMLELARFEKSAAEGTRLERGAPVVVDRL